MEGTTGGNIGLEQFRDYLRENKQAREVNEMMEETPSEVEIKDAVKELRKSVLWEDEIMISYLKLNKRPQ